MAKKRSLSIDIAKGTAIIAIVLGHIAFEYPSSSLVSSGVLLFGLWHVAVFFLLAGFLLMMINWYSLSYGLKRSSHLCI